MKDRPPSSHRRPALHLNNPISGWSELSGSGVSAIGAPPPPPARPQTIHSTKIYELNFIALALARLAFFVRYVRARRETSLMRSYFLLPPARCEGRFVKAGSRGRKQPDPRGRRSLEGQRSLLLLRALLGYECHLFWRGLAIRGADIRTFALVTVANCS